MQTRKEIEPIKQGISGDRVRSLWTPRETHVDPSLPAWKRKYWEDVKALKQKKQAQIEGPQSLAAKLRIIRYPIRVLMMSLISRISKSGFGVQINAKSGPTNWDCIRSGDSNHLLLRTSTPLTSLPILVLIRRAPTPTLTS